MKIFRSALIFVFVIGIISFLSVPQVNYADEVDDAVNQNPEVQEKRSELENLEIQNTNLQRKIESLEGQQDSINAQIDVLSYEAEITQNDLDAIQIELSTLEDEISTLEDEISIAKVNFDHQIMLYTQNLNQSYIMNQSSFLDVLVGTDSLSNAARIMENNEIINSRNQDILTKLDDISADLDEKLRVASTKKAEAESKKDEMVKKQAELEDQIAVQQSLLIESSLLESSYSTLIDKNIAARNAVEAEVQRIVAEVEAEARRQEEERLRQAEQSGQGTTETGTTSETQTQTPQETPVQASEGGYIWPLTGTITMNFWESYPDWLLEAYPWLKQGNNRYHTGIDIAREAGASIVAPKDGTIALVKDFGSSGYGRMIMINHHDGIVTVYGHMNSFSVSEGQEVTKGQQIGTVGSTGFSTGSHLHLEFREDGVLVNPRIYLP